VRTVLIQRGTGPALLEPSPVGHRDSSSPRKAKRPAPRARRPRSRRRGRYRRPPRRCARGRTRDEWDRDIHHPDCWQYAVWTDPLRRPAARPLCVHSGSTGRTQPVLRAPAPRLGPTSRRDVASRARVSGNRSSARAGGATLGDRSATTAGPSTTTSGTRSPARFCARTSTSSGHQAGRPPELLPGALAALCHVTAPDHGEKARRSARRAFSVSERRRAK
jgi:hypothetical protein